MPKVFNLINQRFGKLLVLERDFKIIPKRVNTCAYWICKCECGNIKSISTLGLKTNGTKSCGCLIKDTNKKRLTTHGKCNTTEYNLWRSAGYRAKRDKVPFNLTIEDIVIPTVCPVLGIPLYVGNLNYHDNSPSLDKFNPNLGHIKGNIQVISFKANRIKNDTNFNEFERVYLWYKNEIYKRSTK